MSDKQKNIRESFLTAMFSLLGFVANCDGPINRAEITRIKFYMDKMQLSDDEHRMATQCIKSGAAPDFDLSQTLVAFKGNTTPKLIHILLVYLVTLARADGFLKKKEMHVIQRIARELGYRSIVFNHLLKMISTQDELYSRLQQPQQEQATNNPVYEQPMRYHKPASQTHTANKPRKNTKLQSEELQVAYEVLGVTAEMTDDEIRRAYKKLAGQFHPDKLISQEMPQDARAAATEQFKQIQVAYAFIKRYRSIYTAN